MLRPMATAPTEKATVETSAQRLRVSCSDVALGGQCDGPPMHASIEPVFALNGEYSGHRARGKPGGTDAEQQVTG